MMGQKKSGDRITNKNMRDTYNLGQGFVLRTKCQPFVASRWQPIH